MPITGGDSRSASEDMPLNPPPPLLSPMMLLAGGLLATDGMSGLVANELPSGRQLGQVTIGGPSQGSALAVSPDGRRAFMLDASWLVDQQRAEWGLKSAGAFCVTVAPRTCVPPDLLLTRARRARVGVSVATGCKSVAPTCFAVAERGRRSAGVLSLVEAQSVRQVFERCDGRGLRTM